MERIESNKLTAFDVDDTLLIYDPKRLKNEKPDVVIDGIGFFKHRRHIEQLKSHWARQHTILVWSQGGADWAEQVVKELGLTSYVNYVMDKPYWCYDDRPEWPDWIFLEDCVSE